jgi:hypothetical protein
LYRCIRKTFVNPKHNAAQQAVSRTAQLNVSAPYEDYKVSVKCIFKYGEYTVSVKYIFPIRPINAAPNSRPQIVVYTRIQVSDPDTAESLFGNRMNVCGMRNMSMQNATNQFRVRNCPVNYTVKP